ncbi:MAG: hypothetical protein ABIL68_05505 [bacterium]
MASTTLGTDDAVTKSDSFHHFGHAVSPGFSCKVINNRPYDQAAQGRRNQLGVPGQSLDVRQRVLPCAPEYPLKKSNAVPKPHSPEPAQYADERRNDDQRGLV